MLVALHLLFATSVASGTTLVAVSEAEQVRRADAILIGFVEESWTFVDDAGHVRTRASLRAERAFKGEKRGAVLLVEVPGGQLEGGLETWVHGAPVLGSSDRWLGFLHRRADGVYLPLGLSLGLMPVREAEDGALLVRRDPSGLHFVDATGKRAHPAPLSESLMTEYGLELDQASGASTQGSERACLPSGTTFNPRGDHWVTPMSGDPFTYRVQQDGAPGLTLTASRTAIKTAFEEWTDVDCAGEPLRLEFVNGPDYPTKDGGDDEGSWSFEHVIYWVADDWTQNTGFAPGTLSSTISQFGPNTGYVATADIIFNGDEYSWRFDGAGCTLGDPQCFDVLSVALHEVGHWMGLLHVGCPDARMYPTASATAEETTISPHDLDGICAVYNPTLATVTTSQWGAECVDNSDCPGNLCYTEEVSGHTLAFCTASCLAHYDCPGPWICWVGGNNDTFCAPGVKECIDDSDDDDDGFRACDECDDLDANTYPGATELCDGRDNDCDSLMPGEEDLDGDGHLACATDCDDVDPSTHGGAPEDCFDLVDNNCDGSDFIEEVDIDGDGWSICSGDCDDLDATTFPEAEELCDGRDNDCDGVVPSNEADTDADGSMVCDGDCDDGDVRIRHDWPELCGDEIDNDCDGDIDEDCACCGCASGPGHAELLWLLLPLAVLRRRRSR
jgi:hypothetical protein